MNYVERHFGDWAKDTAHLSMLEDGAYNRLCDCYYVREQPLPADMGACCRLVRAMSKQERAAVKAVLDEFFELTEAGWTHKRCDAEIERFRTKSGKAAASANARWAGKRSQEQSDMRTHEEGNATRGRGRARSHSPSTNLSEANASGSAGAPPDPADVIFGLGVPLLTAAGVADRNARSMLGMQRKQHGDQAVIAALQRCASEKPLQPVAWLQAALKAAARPPPNRQQAVEEENRRIAQEWAQESHP